MRGDQYQVYANCKYRTRRAIYSRVLILEENVKRTFLNAILPVLTIALASCNPIPDLQTQIPMPTSTSLYSVQSAPATTNTPSPIPVDTTSPSPQETSLPYSAMPTTLVLEQGLIWLECVIPDRDYYYGSTDIEALTSCFDIPEWDDYDSNIRGERIPGVNGSDLRLVIESDTFETKFDSSGGCCEYELLKNGEVILNTSAPLITFDPNRNFWNIEGKLVWELIAQPPVIIVDGHNFNEKYQLDGSYFPYEIKGKLIYIANKNGKYNIVYDNEVIGPDFDEITRAYCCGYRSVAYGNGQYWFLGKREGTRYVVLIR